MSLFVCVCLFVSLHLRIYLSVSRSSLAPLCPLQQVQPLAVEYDTPPTPGDVITFDVYSNFSSPAVGVTVVSYAVNGVLQPLAAFSEVAAGQYAVQYTMLNSLDPWDGFLLQLSLSSNEHLETRVVPGSRHLLISTVHSDIAVGSGVGDIDNGAVPSACCRPFFASMSHFSRSRFCT